jgi:ABC-type polysaccharide/polyol phosphate transport system ATPase subunit
MIDLQFDRVSKQYRIRANQDSPKRWYARAFAKRSGEMWALRDVSFQVNEGEAKLRFAAGLRRWWRSALDFILS